MLEVKLKNPNFLELCTLVKPPVENWTCASRFHVFLCGLFTIESFTNLQNFLSLPAPYFAL